MRVLKAIIVENDIETIKQFKKFEVENSVLFSIIEIVQNTNNLADLVNNHNPDLLIVSLDEINFDENTLSNLNVQKPKLVIISKDKDFAFDAYKQNAIDFLIKPISPSNFIISLYKIIKWIDMEVVYQNETIGKIKAVNTPQQNFEFLAIASVDKIDLIRKKDIICCKADGKYTEFYAINAIKLISSRNLGEYSLSLDNNFFRIHHSYFINIRYVEKIIKKDGLYCEMSNGLVLPVAKRRQEEFIKFINL